LIIRFIEKSKNFPSSEKPIICGSDEKRRKEREIRKIKINISFYSPYYYFPEIILSKTSCGGKPEEISIWDGSTSNCLKVGSTLYIFPL